MYSLVRHFIYFALIRLQSSTGGADRIADFALLPEDPSESFNVMSQFAVWGTELTETNTMYLEWFGIFSDGLIDEFVVSFLNAGIDHDLTNNLMVDFCLGMGLSDDADDFFTGVGGGYHF